MPIITSNPPSVRWTWTIPDAPGRFGFGVRRSEDGGKTWQVLAVLGPEARGFTDTTVVKGVHYLWEFPTFYAAAASNQVGATIPVDPPVVLPDITPLPPGKPTILP